MKLVYFAWVREKTGIGEEEVPLPDSVSNVEELLEWLKGRGGGMEAAFSDLSVIRVAVNLEHVHTDHPVTEGDEVAFFPPVTGG